MTRRRKGDPDAPHAGVLPEVEEETVAEDQIGQDDDLADVDVDTKTHEAEGSLVNGWPAILLTIAMISAAVYAFSPRPHPPVPETQIKASDLMTSDIAHQNGRYIAVGELGRILYADSANGPWQQASVEPERGFNLTTVRFVADGIALAAGHSGWLLRSEDGGKTWKELRFTENASDPLLGIGGPFKGEAAGRLFAFGAFGQLLVSTDGGSSWQQNTINVVEDEVEGEVAEDEASAQSDSDDIFGMGDGGGDDYDPFAAFESGAMATDYTSRHMYDMAQARDGTLFLVGERGMILRSSDGGDSWEALEEIYTGSFYGITALANDSLLVYGMRGHAFVSSDLGDSWQASNVPLVQGLYDAAVDSSGMIVVVGGSNTVLVSSDHGLNFIKASKRGPDAFASILTLGKNRWLLAGEGGVGKKSMFNSVPATTGDAS
ncbi:MAG: hypothetical protein R3352_02450 [Salinisphaeraceae bacterium]|nr:hypothetical protein [Salinisphaeraceae bacterium]